MVIERSKGVGGTHSGQRGPGFLAILLGLCIVGCSRLPSSEQQKEGPTRRHASDLKAPRKIAFVVFSAKWCGVCRDVPAVLEQLRATFPAVSFHELDIDEKENEKLWLEYGSDAVPYNYILVDGKVIAKFRGFLPPANAEKFVRDTIEKLDSPREPVSTAGRELGNEPRTGNQNIEAWTIDPALNNLLGKHLDGKELQAFSQQMGEAPEVEKFDKYETSYESWKSKGVSLCFNGKGVLTCIFLYSENTDDFHAYKGALPGNLSWNDTRTDVHRKFGKPDSVTPGCGKVINLMDDYDTQGVTVDYHSQDPADMKTLIKMFRIIPKKAPK